MANVLRSLSIRTKFALIALCSVVAAIGMVILMMPVLLQLGESSERGWQRLAASQLITAANRTRDLMATTLSQSVRNAGGLTPIEANAQQQQIHTLAQQLRQALGKGNALHNPADRERFLAALEESRLPLDEYITISEKLSTLVAGGQYTAAQAAWPELTTSFAQLGTSMAQLEDAVTQDATTLTEAARFRLLRRERDSRGRPDQRRTRRRAAARRAAVARGARSFGRPEG